MSVTGRDDHCGVGGDHVDVPGADQAPRVLPLPVALSVWVTVMVDRSAAWVTVTVAVGSELPLRLALGDGKAVIVTVDTEIAAVPVTAIAGGHEQVSSSM